MREAIATCLGPLARRLCLLLVTVGIAANCGSQPMPTSPTALPQPQTIGSPSTTSNAIVYLSPNTDELISIVPESGRAAGRKVRYFARKAVDGTPVSLSEVVVQADPMRNTASLQMLFDNSNRLVKAVDANGRTLEVTWPRDTTARFTFRSPDDREGVSGEVPAFSSSGFDFRAAFGPRNAFNPLGAKESCSFVLDLLSKTCKIASADSLCSFLGIKCPKALSDFAKDTEVPCAIADNLNDPPFTGKNVCDVVKETPDAPPPKPAAPTQITPLPGCPVLDSISNGPLVTGQRTIRIEGNNLLAVVQAEITPEGRGTSVYPLPSLTHQGNTGYAARKVDQYAAQKVIHLRAVHSTWF